jgi:hypothetical protein
MKVHKISEREMDERLALDKRHDHKAFYRYFGTEEELPAEFHDLQDRIRDGLEKEFWINFEDGADHSKIPSWRQPSNKFFFFPAELMNCELVKLEMSDEILGDKLLGIIMSYLEKCAPGYGINIAVYREVIEGSGYIGRFVTNLDEIAVEESLAESWSKRVKFMPIEETTDAA